MVAHGVKGRPQACVTCHRRKKGCDLQRPSCGQCRKACIPCGGYNRGPAVSKAKAAAAASAMNSSSKTSTTDIISRSSSHSGSSSGHGTPSASSTSAVAGAYPAGPTSQPILPAEGFPTTLYHGQVPPVYSSTPGTTSASYVTAPGVPAYVDGVVSGALPYHPSASSHHHHPYPPPPSQPPTTQGQQYQTIVPHPTTTAPYPRISYPDLSGTLTLQPRYPSHSSSVSANDTYASFSPSPSVAYYANDQSNSSSLPVASYPPSVAPPTSNPPSYHHIPPASQHYQHDQTYHHQEEEEQQQQQQEKQQQPAQIAREQHTQRRLQLLRARQRQQQQQQQISHQHATSDIQISTAISKSATHDRLIGLFWEAFLPNAKPLPTKTLQITLGGAVGAIGSFDWNGDILQRGLLAMALTTVGKRQLALQKKNAAEGRGGGGVLVSGEAERMRREGIRLYGSSLQQMSQMLGQRKKWTTEHWVTTRLFSLYEALYGADLQDHLAHRESWMVHSQGDIAFITSKPPAAYISDPAHTLFTAGRHHLVLYALLTRRRCVLAEPAWKWVPWSEHPKSARDLLLDIIIDIPAIWEAIDTINSWPDDDVGGQSQYAGKKEAARQMTRHGLASIITRLLEWHSAHAMPTVPPSLDDPPPPVATPEQFLAVHVMTLFWAICIRVYKHDCALLRPDRGEFPDPRIDPDECCRAIVNTIRIFVQPSTGICRQHFTAFPMSTAMHHLIDIGPQRMTKERASLWADLNKPHCILIKHFLLNMEPPKYRNAEEAALGP